MKTNVLGLPSLTGFTPLKASQEALVLEYDFRGVGPRVLDKSGNLHGGTLMPLWPVDSPRRTVPPKTLKFDGENDFVRGSSDLDGMSEITVAIRLKPLVSPGEIDKDGGIISKMYNETYELTLGKDGGFFFQVTGENGERQYAHGGEWKKNQWTEIVGCYATRQSHTPRIYQDGEQVGSATRVGTVGTNDKPLTIGARPGPSNFSKIEIDWIRIYRRYLESV